MDRAPGAPRASPSPTTTWPACWGQVLSVLAERQVNVIDMMNKSRGELAYNIIDVDGAPDPAVTAAIQAVPYVIRVRVV